ncbi:hypothetical protein JYT84_00225 [bacterium AH-315-M10]|nr:hypothetical protein [bacterium AH-315-M10]
MARSAVKYDTILTESGEHRPAVTLSFTGSTMHKNTKLAEVLKMIDLGSDVAETDHVLQHARVDTAAFSSLYNDRVDLIPGTKGSGKSALYRLFVQFLAPRILESRRVLIAHGVEPEGDITFQEFQSVFGSLSERDFTNFWCVYLVSLAHEEFIKSPRFKEHVEMCKAEIAEFEAACMAARIPRIEKAKSLRDVITWVVNAIRPAKAKIKGRVATPLFAGELGSELEFQPPAMPVGPPMELDKLPRYTLDIKKALEKVLEKADLQLWLMMDRLDELFPRGSPVESRALRGLLRTLRIFDSDSRIRVKVFLRDDIFRQITEGPKGFTALTHVTSRMADALSWTGDEILTLIVKRIFGSSDLCEFVGVDVARLFASQDYRQECFYRVFPETVHSGKRQSKTHRWIYNHCMDGNRVVTPRDVIYLLKTAQEYRIKHLLADSDGEGKFLFDPQAILYGHGKLSTWKRTSYILAEFKHFEGLIDKFVGGKAEYTEDAIRKLLGRDSDSHLKNLRSIGLLEKLTKKGKTKYSFPYLYRQGMQLTRGLQE